MEKKGNKLSTRIHRSRPSDVVRDDIADQLARVISEIQLQLFGTPYTFVVGEACAKYGVEFGDAA